MRRLLLVAGFAVSMVAATGARAEAVLGAGTATCREWTASETDNVLQLVERLAWIEGYVSATVQHQHIDFHKEADVVGIKAWIDRYCGEQPDDSLAIVADRLAAAIVAAPPPPQPK